ncbi:molecular chaperone TorD family protein [Neobacillus sp. WH10]|uniref:TorD/DmsD family molecular chaperone n=1 Tax=Neobacillus sp. WH10 TaxID=3047873 RepID=UPI0024C1F647|nr:molecular chaperone TorD family protein [Neobacillus sp. WH10]WHY75665.1 molecular chaperone TorD family protein [Neobacillus sp. WH10]
MPPNNKVLEEIRNSANFHGLEEVHEGGKILQHFFGQLTNEQINKEKEEYQRLFIGPGPLAAPPWESYYRSKEKLLFEEWTYQIREQYHQFGLQFIKENKEPDDHLLLELEFMIFLADKSMQEVRPERILELIVSQVNFIEKHLTIWIPFFCAKVIENTKSKLYLGAAMLLEDFLSFDLKSLLELGEALTDV